MYVSQNTDIRFKKSDYAKLSALELKKEFQQSQNLDPGDFQTQQSEDYHLSFSHNLSL